MDLRTDEETLEALEAEIAREQEEILALRHKTRLLEIETELKPWKQEEAIRAYRASSSAWMDRTKIETVLGILITGVVAAIVNALGSRGLP